MRTATNKNSTGPYEVNTGTSEANENLSRKALENQYMRLTKTTLTTVPYKYSKAASENLTGAYDVLGILAQYQDQICLGYPLMMPDPGLHAAFCI